jgi:hypothetical protein
MGKYDFVSEGLIGTLDPLLGHDHLGHRAVLHAGAASRAQIFDDAAGPFSDFYLEFTRGSFNGFNVRVGDKLDVQVPADLDQFG